MEWVKVTYYIFKMRAVCYVEAMFSEVYAEKKEAKALARRRVTES